MNVTKKRTFPGYEDGPGQKRLAHTSKQDGQAQGSATKEDACIPQQVISRLPLYQEMTVQKQLDACTESIWSGTLKFHTRPQSQSNDQRQAMVISSCSVHLCKKINTVNWPKQLKMHTIHEDDYVKLLSLHVVRARVHVHVDFSVDEDCDKMSHRAFIQSTSWPNCGCALLEYTSYDIRLLFLRSLPIGDENVTFVFIRKYTYQDRVVEFLTDLGILSYAITANILAKENASLKEELQQKDKMLVEQQTLHQEKVDRLKTTMIVEGARMQRERDVMEKQIIEKDGTIFQKDSALFLKNSALKEKDEALMKKDEALMKKDEAISERDSALVVKDTELMKKDNTIMTVEQEKDELQQENNELVNEVHTKQAALANIQKEFECGICTEPLNKATIMDCGHSFCDECIQTNRKEDVRCPNCRARLETYKFRPCFIIDSCLEVIKETRRKESVREKKGEPIQGELEVQSQSMSEESGDDPSPVSPSSGHSASSFCRSPSSIENMFSSDSSSDSN